jgi:hypothetical protein
MRLRIFDKNVKTDIYFFSKRIEKWIFEEENLECLFNKPVEGRMQNLKLPCGGERQYCLQPVSEIVYLSNRNLKRVAAGCQSF